MGFYVFPLDTKINDLVSPNDLHSASLPYPLLNPDQYKNMLKILENRSIYTENEFQIAYRSIIRYSMVEYVNLDEEIWEEHYKDFTYVLTVNENNIMTSWHVKDIDDKFLFEYHYCLIFSSINDEPKFYEMQSIPVVLFPINLWLLVLYIFIGILSLIPFTFASIKTGKKIQKYIHAKRLDDEILKIKNSMDVLDYQSASELLAELVRDINPTDDLILKSDLKFLMRKIEVNLRFLSLHKKFIKLYGSGNREDAYNGLVGLSVELNKVDNQDVVDPAIKTIVMESLKEIS